MRLTTHLRGWAGAAHPFPVAAVVALTALLGLASTDGEPNAGRLVLVLLAMLCSQLAIGWSNDYLDRDVDAVHQRLKPIPSGLVEPRLVPRAIGAALLLSLAAGVPLGPTALALLLVGTACGFVYNLWFKRTHLGFVPFVIAFAVLPAYVWTALHAYRDDFLGLYAIAVPLAVAAHLANVLPDIETDAAQGRRTLAVVLGRTRTPLVLGVCLIAPLVLFTATLRWFDYDKARFIFDSFLIVWVVLAYCVLCLLTFFLYATMSGRETEVRGFRLVTVASVLFASGWLASV